MMDNLKQKIIGKNAPLIVRFVELDGREIFTQDYPNFSGESEESFDFSEKKGQLIMQIVQGKEQTALKIMIQ